MATAAQQGNPRPRSKGEYEKSKETCRHGHTLPPERLKSFSNFPPIFFVRFGLFFVFVGRHLNYATIVSHTRTHAPGRMVYEDIFQGESLRLKQPA